MRDPIIALVERFRQIGEARIRGLPIYHEGLDVEAVDFQACDDGVLGALITPWFMNIMLLPCEPTDQTAALGDTVIHELPCGEQTFTINEDEVIGVYHFQSLASPMFRFKTQDGARATARRALERMMTHPEEQPSDVPPEGCASCASTTAATSRRAFLRLKAR